MMTNDLLELVYPGHHLEVLLVTEVHVIVARVPGVEGVVTDHVECLLWQLTLFVILQYPIQVLCPESVKIYIPQIR